MPAFFINDYGNNLFKFGYALGVNGCNCPLNQDEKQFQFVNNWTKIAGNHTLKFGADIRQAHNLRMPSDQHRAGQLSFNAAGTQGPSGGGSGLATFLLGDVQLFQRYVSSVNDARETQNRWFFFGQDSWRVTSEVDLELWTPVGVVPSPNSEWRRKGRIHRLGHRRGAGSGIAGGGHEPERVRILECVRTAHRHRLPVEPEDRDPKRLWPWLRSWAFSAPSSVTT